MAQWPQFPTYSVPTYSASSAWNVPTGFVSDPYSAYTTSATNGWAGAAYSLPVETPSYSAYPSISNSWATPAVNTVPSQYHYPSAELQLRSSGSQRRSMSAPRQYSPGRYSAAPSYPTYGQEYGGSRYEHPRSNEYPQYAADNTYGSTPNGRFHDDYYRRSFDDSYDPRYDSRHDPRYGARGSEHVDRYDPRYNPGADRRGTENYPRQERRGPEYGGRRNDYGAQLQLSHSEQQRDSHRGRFVDDKYDPRFDRHSPQFSSRHSPPRIANGTPSSPTSPKSVSFAPSSPTRSVAPANVRGEPYCHYCKAPVDDDDDFTAEERSFHPQCFRCHACGLPPGPTVEFYRHGDVYYCARDYHNGPSSRCVFCNHSIAGTRLTNFYGEQICRSHKAESYNTDCQDCGRIVPSTSPMHRRYNPGKRLQCESCLNNSIHDSEDAKRLFALVRCVMDKEFNMGIRRIKVPLAVLSIPQLQQAGTHTPHSQAPGMIGGVTKCDVVHGEHIVKWIGVPGGVSRDRMGMIMAHELMHTLLFSGGFQISKLGLQLEEGLCELASYLWMSSSSEKDKPVYHFWKDQMLKGTNPIYQIGFQKVKKAYDAFARTNGPERALPALLEYVAKNKALPAL